MRLFMDCYWLFYKNKTYILQELNYDCSREAFAIRRHTIS